MCACVFAKARVVIAKDKRKQTKPQNHFGISNRRWSNLRLPSLKADPLTTEPQGPCLRKILPSYSLWAGCPGLGFGLVVVVRGGRATQCVQRAPEGSKQTFTRLAFRDACAAGARAHQWAFRILFVHVFCSLSCWQTNLHQPPLCFCVFLLLFRMHGSVDTTLLVYIYVLHIYIQYTNKIALKIRGTLDLLWWKFPCTYK